jgi:uncharacterized membrane protein
VWVYIIGLVTKKGKAMFIIVSTLFLAFCVGIFKFVSWALRPVDRKIDAAVVNFLDAARQDREIQKHVKPYEPK